MAILEIKDVRKYFGGVKAVDGVAINVEPKEVRAVIGPNGAGKSTLLNVVCGRYPPTSGSIIFNGKEITGLDPHKISRLGIGKSFQVTNIFEGLTVYENIQIPVISFAGRGMNFYRPMRNFTDIREKVLILAEAVGLEDKLDFPCSALSHGERRHLEIALALAGEPKVLILDEPTAGMTPFESRQTMELIKKLSEERGVTIVFAEHDMDVVFGASDKITVMHQGKIIAEGNPDEIRKDDLVKRVYLGQSYESP